QAFLSIGIPVQLRGIGGPRAPHVFELDRRDDLGPQALSEAVDPFWQLQPHRHDVFIRTKHNMADEQYTFCLLYVPFEVAKIRLPRGLPAGIAPRNPISEDVKKDIIKHLPVMRALGLDAGADYLHAWAMGELPLEQLLE
ncbi:unnamed protein product, partial [Durusdinium trenchii]